MNKDAEIEEAAIYVSSFVTRLQLILWQKRIVSMSSIYDMENIVRAANAGRKLGILPDDAAIMEIIRVSIVYYLAAKRPRNMLNQEVRKLAEIHKQLFDIAKLELDREIYDKWFQAYSMKCIDEGVK